MAAGRYLGEASSRLPRGSKRGLATVVGLLGVLAASACSGEEQSASPTASGGTSGPAGEEGGEPFRGAAAGAGSGLGGATGGRTSSMGGAPPTGGAPLGGSAAAVAGEGGAAGARATIHAGAGSSSGGAIPWRGTGGALGGGATTGGVSGAATGDAGGAAGAELGSLLPWTCGDGLVEGTERCDDGNRENGDGCSEHCSLERCDLCLELAYGAILAPVDWMGCDVFADEEPRVACLYSEACLLECLPDAEAYFLANDPFSRGWVSAKEVPPYCYCGEPEPGISWEDWAWGCTWGSIEATGMCREVFYDAIATVQVGLSEDDPVANMLSDSSLPPCVAMTRVGCERNMQNSTCKDAAVGEDCSAACVPTPTTAGGAGGTGTGGSSSGTGGEPPSLLGGAGGTTSGGALSAAGAPSITAGAAGRWGDGGAGGAAGIAAGGALTPMPEGTPP